MDFAPFEALLRRSLGLDPESLGRSALESAVRRRMQALGLSDPEAYLDLAGSLQEVGELVEEVVVPETWFFRDGEPFRLLADFARGRGAGTFKALSAPCSTGEEAYSMAVSLLSVLPPESVRVQAVDISRRALAQARVGLYGPNSFRAGLPAYAEPFFLAEGERRRVSPRAAERVEFFQGNLAEGFAPDRGYQAVFCRNFLIYLDQEGKRRMVDYLERILAPDGLLFVGHAEAMPLFFERFRPVEHPRAFAFAKARPAPRAPAPRPAAEARPAAPAAPARPALARPAAPARPAPPAAPPAAPIPDLDSCRTLADQGRLAEAESRCRGFLAAHPASADGWHLLGLLAEAGGGEERAAELYAKALYLNPAHVESLAHLSLLAERRGEAEKARLLRGRLSKAAGGRT